MMTARMPVFHIGTNKADSTTLKRVLFARHPESLSLGKPSPSDDAERAVSKILEFCDRRSDRGQKLDESLVRESWLAAVAQAGKEGRVPVFSREELIRDCFYAARHPTRLPEAVAAMVGGACILLLSPVTS